MWDNPSHTIRTAKRPDNPGLIFGLLLIDSVRFFLEVE